MAAMTPKEFIQHLRDVYDEVISKRRFVYSEWFKEKGERLREAYRQLACAEWASSYVHADMLVRFKDLDTDLKTKVARQVWEEARHCKDVKALLKEISGEDFNVHEYSPVEELTQCFYEYYHNIDDPGAYFAAHNAAGERTALRMLEKVSAFASEAGMDSLARVAAKIVPEERFHVRLGEQVVEKYATTEERQRVLEKFFREGLDAHWNYTEGVYRKINSISE
ncbi:MAG: hypothetical protein V3V56_00025 [bacterium]